MSAPDQIFPLLFLQPTLFLDRNTAEHGELQLNTWLKE